MRKLNESGNIYQIWKNFPFKGIVLVYSIT